MTKRGKAVRSSAQRVSNRGSRGWVTPFRAALLGWFRRHARDLPWRRTRDPYAIWISEIMLQQTQVATVIGYYHRFLEAFPNVNTLASAPETEVLRLWEGLGYYRRARQLHAAAKHVAEKHGGRFPSDFDAIYALPGIGRYTAGAIASIAFEQSKPILEANTIRLWARLAGIQDDVAAKATQTRLWGLAESVLTDSRSGEINQALMEVGGQVCKPQAPQCHECPVMSWCGAQRTGRPESIPRVRKKIEYEEVREIALVVRHNDRILVRQCGPKERWAGLWDFPRFAIGERNAKVDPQDLATRCATMTGIKPRVGELLATIRHGVTRFRITLDCYQANASGRGRCRNTARWVSTTELAELPLSVSGRRLATMLRNPTKD